MRSSRRPLPPSWRLVIRPALAPLTILLLVLATIESSEGQTPAPDPPATAASALRDARAALRSGQYDVVEELTRSLAAPGAALLRAKAAIAQGRYDDARSWLAPLAESDPGGPAALELGLLHLSLGRRPEGERLLVAVLERSAEDDGALGDAARAAHALGQVQRANELFREAAAVAGDDPELQTAWGELLVEKHNNGDAARSFRVAIQSDRRYAPAWVGLGRTMADENPPAARQLAQRALTINPSLVAAHVLLAELALDERDREGAQAAVDRALAINPASLEARSITAAIAYLEDRTADFDREVAAVLAVHPGFGAVYRIVGAHAARHYRFDEAVALARRGLAIDPDDSRALAELGLHLLRTGDEPGARAVLERAFRDDPYDVVTYNLLGLLDTLDKFETVEDGVITMRLHPDEAGVLREHALPLARDALRAIGERYGFTPEPILVEIFPRHDDFAVRNLGLPGMVGALGACFGRVITLDSPRARPPGTFNWQATLWHELAHVVTLQLSKGRVPRWLTEGISVYEEQRARLDWGREMQMTFVEMMHRGEVIPLADLNQAFGNPATISLAYYQASLLVDHLVSAYGHDALTRLLRAYGEGLDTDAAVKQVMGVGMPALQSAFEASLERRFGAMRAALSMPEDARLGGQQPAVEALRAVAADHPGSYPMQLALAQALQEAGDVDRAIAAYEAADALVPLAAGEESPLALIAKLAAERGDRARAAAALERLLARNDKDVAAARQLVTLLDDPAERSRQARAHARVAELDPFDAAAQSALGRTALAAGDAETAARRFRTALAAGSEDPVSAHCDLADAYWQLGARTDAKRQTLAALEIAPTYPRAQDLLLTIVDGQP